MDDFDQADLELLAESIRQYKEHNMQIWNMSGFAINPICSEKSKQCDDVLALIFKKMELTNAIRNET